MSEPKTFGRYRIIRPIGQGGTATVYLATDGQAEIALKVLHSQLALDPVVRERFRRELELSRRLSHPNIVRVFDQVAEGERVAAVMEYCPGGSLAERGTISPGEAERLVRALAPALALAHDNGVVHRDLKPENILFSAEGEPKLCDFGSARVQDLMGLTATTSFLSTPLYLPPEGCHSPAADPRWDLYSLGAVLYQALSGRPHRGTGLADLMASGSTRPVSLSSIVSDLPPRLASLVDALLGPRERRPRHAMSLPDFLDGVVEALPPDAKRCLFCGAAMAADCPVCLACGEADLHPHESDAADAETVVLTKVPEDAEAMGALFAFMRAWSGEEAGKIRFITEDVRMYSKEEKAGQVSLPHPLIAKLEPAQASLVIALIGRAGKTKVGAARWGAARAERKFKKKKALLPTVRPWPEASEASFFERHRGALAEGRTTLAPAPASGSDTDRLFRSLLLDVYRLVEGLKAGGKAGSDLLPLAEDLAERYRMAATGLVELEAELSALSPGALYAEHQRIEAKKAACADMASRDYAELLERERVNRQASERQEAAERAYGRDLARLLESGARLSRLVATMEGRELDEKAIRDLDP